MSKYGFNEKELRKTIVTMIDKDGFHKEIVTYGNEPYSPDSPDSPDDSGDKLFAQAEWDYNYTMPLIFVYNIPSEREDLRAVGYAHTTNDAYEFDIGQTATISSSSDSANFFTDIAYLYRPNAFMIDPQGAIRSLDLSAVTDNNLHYSIYLVRMEEDGNSFTVIDRTKTISGLPVTNPAG